MLVDYEVLQIAGNSPEYVSQLYQGEAFWANPSVEHAAHSMHQVCGHRGRSPGDGPLGQRSGIRASARGADPPDRVADIVGDEQGAVAGDLDADRAAHAPCRRR